MTAISARETRTAREDADRAGGTPIRVDSLSRAVPRLQVLDTFPAFERFWRQVHSEPIAIQIDRWEHEYMATWPELLAKLKQNYSEEGEDWKRIARTRIFPHLTERLPRMRRLHRNLVQTLPDSWAKTARALELDFPVQFVIYVGIGVGAGWATPYDGKPAVLFGLENAAEIATGKDEGMPGAVSHEVAHLAHDEWRRRDCLRATSSHRGPYWQLYAEGFATECERRISDPRAFRLRTGRADWVPWCSSHRAWLAAKFLRDVKARRSVRPFFGSWHNIRGQIECGYYLGQEMVREWAETEPLRHVAVIPEPIISRKAKATLLKMAARPPA
jgi:hypothetical protein